MNSADIKLRNELVSNVARMLGIPMAHWDHIEYRHSPFNKDKLLEVPTCATIYAHRYGHWQAMILQDMNILRPSDFTNDMRDLAIEASRFLVKHGHDDDGETLKQLKRLTAEIKNERRLNNKVRKYLIENNGIRLLTAKFA